jgi:hypothetical protein
LARYPPSRTVGLESKPIELSNFERAPSTPIANQ